MKVSSLLNISVSTIELEGVNLLSEEYGVSYGDKAYGECSDNAPVNNGSKDDKGSPGFELIMVLVTIVISIILLRKKRT
jgi:hypothetical protein